MKIQYIGTAEAQKLKRRSSVDDKVVDKAIKLLTPKIEIVLDHITVEAGDINATQKYRTRILNAGERLGVHIRIVWQLSKDKSTRQPVIMLETRRTARVKASEQNGVEVID
jgi:hypothetical protein